MKEFVDKLRKRSKVFKKNAKLNYKNGEYDIAMFDLEQATQLMLKSKILEFGVQFPKVHEISELMKTLEKLGVDLKSLRKQFSQTIENLNFAYISSRYLPFSFSENDVKKALEFIKKLEAILWKQ